MNIIKSLEKYIESDDLEYIQNQTAEILEKSPDSEKYIPDILALMEDNPLADWGCPGGLVHFMESCDTAVYERLLKESVTRCPTEHTLFMFNRLCNAKSPSELPQYIDILDDIMKNTSLPEDVRKSAENFLEYQLERIIV
ncbi:MAG: hypothetical protein NC177_11775 [Ruminococcus flavefaciens]|nr:hypothetical protein [Ruminococcus flavefaciens]